MKRVGILVGREVTFPESIINSINEKGDGEVVAEMVTIGGIRLDEPKKYDVIIDRISHEVPYYRATLKAFCSRRYVHHQQSVLVVGGRQVFQLLSLAAKIGVAIPKTVLLPQHDYISDITSESLAISNFRSTGKALSTMSASPLF